MPVIILSLLKPALLQSLSLLGPRTRALSRHRGDGRTLTTAEEQLTRREASIRATGVLEVKNSPEQGLFIRARLQQPLDGLHGPLSGSVALRVTG
jgi:hypothetical protein